MIQANDYRGREQTYVKHVFLNHYLERVAWVTLANNRGWQEFVYIDGFAGPWRVSSEDSRDTSVSIALRKLTEVKRGLSASGRTVRMRAIFVEQRPSAFKRLSELLDDFPEGEAVALEGDFHKLSSECARRVGAAFSLVLIDPTTFALDIAALKPVMTLRGEVIINFMYSFLLRNINVLDSQDHLSKTFATDDWRAEIEAAEKRLGSREEGILATFCSAVQRVSGKRFVTSTRVKAPLADRTHFHLVYGTDHWRGLEEFRNVEAKTIPEQEHVRSGAKATARQARTGAADMFPETFADAPLAELEGRREEMRLRAEAALFNLFRTKEAVHGGDILGALLQLPLITKKDVNRVLTINQERGKIVIHLAPGERVIKGTTVVSRCLDAER